MNDDYYDVIEEDSNSFIDCIYELLKLKETFSDSWGNQFANPYIYPTLPSSPSYDPNTYIYSNSSYYTSTNRNGTAYSSGALSEAIKEYEESMFESCKKVVSEYIGMSISDVTMSRIKMDIENNLYASMEIRSQNPLECININMEVR